MGLIVGHLEGSVLKDVGQTDSRGDYGGLSGNARIYCFNGDWPFYGKIDDSTIDDNANVSAP